MKDKIHPKVNPVVFLDVMSSAEFVATSTLHSDEIKKINGIDHFVIRIETSSASHPFYTGNQKTTSRSNQVAKYLEKVAKAQKGNQKKVKVIEEDNTPKAIQKITKTAEKNTKTKAAAKEAAKEAAKTVAKKTTKITKTTKTTSKKISAKKATTKKK